MKRSKQIGLTLLASLSLAACGGADQPTERALYKSKQECVEDWGSDDNCEDDGNNRYRGPHYFYSGGRPFYYSKNSNTAVPVADSAPFSRVAAGTKSPRAASTFSSSTSRGGFGFSSLGRGAFS